MMSFPGTPLDDNNVNHVSGRHSTIFFRKKVLGSE